MSKLHLFKNLGIMAGMLATMLLIALISIDFYTFLMAAIAGWTVGKWVFDWSFKRWPLYTKDTK